jgi:hypothetical protein
MEVFRGDRLDELSPSDCLAHSPIDVLAETLPRSSRDRKIPQKPPDIVPA